MTFRLESREGETCIVLNESDLQALGLRAGDAVDVVPISEGEVSQAFEYISTAEAMQAFEETYAEHESSYLELAK